MSALRCLLAATLLVGLAGTARAETPYSGVTMMRGTVYSIGRADARGDTANTLGSGTFIDANYSSVFLNGGIGAKDFSGVDVANIYAGFGFGRIVQLQAGYGTRGTLGRVRTDLNLREVYSFVTRTKQSMREKTLADRVTFTYTAERYSDKEDEEFSNGTIGIGVLFEGPF